MRKSTLHSASHYNANYGNFQAELYAQIRHEAFGRDIGQNSWLTSDEQDRFLQWLDLSPGKALLDVACGAGGPALRIAASTGCSVMGTDVHEQAVRTASSLAAQRGYYFPKLVGVCRRATQSINCLHLKHLWIIGLRAPAASADRLLMYHAMTKCL